ncbi:hypothetical protein [Mycolicibacterium brisbanense]|uniref:Transposase n=1 Tax=Mycolicibacterium brisbanense TaxID=146020 RepID=A0A117I5S7_9MYCO|nr:hypothetical protein [Mycolicibacterium brisbanense]MCV7158581.1 hypothetical protein [Mycolicibacterium brisbanense]GAS88950.1 putative uncharacterized protein [Mycolicibacterium brisbanense]
MSISPGFSAAEVRAFVDRYHLQPHGQKRGWLAAQGVSESRLRRWQAAVFDGDVDRGLIPRDSGGMRVPPAKRTAVAKARSAAQTEVELARLQARVHELEQSNEGLQKANDALGKAIGLLHAMSEHEPAAAPTSSDRSDSSTPKTDSSPS